MKTKYYSKIIFPLCLFVFIFRVLALLFAVEYSVDSLFYVNGSIIPVIFSVFVTIVVIFFFVYYIWNLIKRISKKKEKEPDEKKQKVGFSSPFAKVRVFNAPITILSCIASVMIISYTASLILDYFSSKTATFSGLFATFTPYIAIVALITVFFFVEFVAAPKFTSQSKVWMVFSFFPAIFYALILFSIFIDKSGIVDRVFLRYDFISFAMIMLALICIPQMMISSKKRSLFFSATMSALFLSTIRFADALVYLVSILGLNKVLNQFAVLSNITDYINFFLAIGNFCLSLALYLIAVRIYKKKKEKPVVKTNLDNIYTESTVTENE